MKKVYYVDGTNVKSIEDGYKLSARICKLSPKAFGPDIDKRIQKAYGTYKCDHFVVVVRKDDLYVLIYKDKERAMMNANAYVKKGFILSSMDSLKLYPIF